MTEVISKVAAEERDKAKGDGGSAVVIQKLKEKKKRRGERGRLGGLTRPCKRKIAYSSLQTRARTPAEFLDARTRA
jgi:hypothetical protein